MTVRNCSGYTNMLAARFAVRSTPNFENTNGMEQGAAPFTVRSTPNFENTNGVEQNTIT